MKNCEQYHPQWIELARSGAAPGGAEREHLNCCADCRGFLETQKAVQEWLRSIQGEEVVAGTVRGRQDRRPGESPARDDGDLEARILAEFDAAHGGNGRRLPWRWAAAAALAMTVAAAVVLVRRPPSPPRTADEPFLEIPYTPPLAPYERTRIVRMQVPVAALIAAGFEVHAADTGSALEADVLFGQDGRAHAIRPAANSTQEN